MDWDTLPFGKSALENYLSSLYPGEVRVTAVEELKDEIEERLKEFGYGVPLLIQFDYDDTSERVVLHTMSPDGFGHEQPSDRARNLLLDHATFNKLPRHVRSLDVGAFASDGRILSLDRAEEFFLLTRFVEGRPYADDLERIGIEGELTSRDRERALSLADYLVEIHQEKRSEPRLYRRRVRDLLGHGEGIMGIVDSYPPDFAPAPPARLELIEKRCVEWRWRIKAWSYRLSQVHGDFHPWNILFRKESEFTLLDRSRGEWGEPADDLSALTINYVLFSLKRYAKLAGPFRQLFELFWERYLQGTGDEQILEVVQPFYAWRALVVANPLWYPSLLPLNREALFSFIERVLAADRFDPQRAGRYLE